MLDALILNRNLKKVTDALVKTLESNVRNIDFVAVIDSGSRSEEVSERTVTRADSTEAAIYGLRLNRGFNLGINWWLAERKESDWILLLPNDAELHHIDDLGLSQVMEQYPHAAAIYPISPDSGYEISLGDRRSGLIWNLQEGPVILSRHFCELLTKNASTVFDPQNFRGYLSFLELSLRAYANNFPIIGTANIAFRENETHLLSKAHLIGTEDLSQNLQLFVEEGERWLSIKYGLSDRWSFENLVRLAFEEFLKVNPCMKLEEVV